MFLLKTVLLTVTLAGVKDWVVGHCISLNWKCGVCDTWVISFNATYQAEEYWLRQVSSANYMLKECCNPNRRKQACVVSQICCCCAVLVQIDPFWYCAALASLTCGNAALFMSSADVTDNKKKNLSIWLCLLEPISGGGVIM